MIRVETNSRFWRDVRDAPKDVGIWAAMHVDAAKAPDATFSQFIAGATPLKGGDFRGSYVHKWRRKRPHGEYRLVFIANEEEIRFISLEPRGADYKIAGRRIRAMLRP